jgi:hypothetical protein
MKPQRSEILGRMIRFLNLDSDGLRRVVLESIVEAREFTVASIHVNKKSYRAPMSYVLRDEYADIARAVLATL